MFLLAQTVWWETLPAQLVMWASAVAAVLYLTKKLFGGAEFARRLALAILVLGSTEKWPNGSTDLFSFLTVSYRRQSEIFETIKAFKSEFEEHIVDFDAHIARHDLNHRG